MCRRCGKKYNAGFIDFLWDADGGKGYNNASKAAVSKKGARRVGGGKSYKIDIGE